MHIPTCRHTHLHIIKDNKYLFFFKKRIGGDRRITISLRPAWPHKGDIDSKHQSIERKDTGLPSAAKGLRIYWGEGLLSCNDYSHVWQPSLSLPKLFCLQLHGQWGDITKGNIGVLIKALLEIWISGPWLVGKGLGHCRHWELGLQSGPSGLAQQLCSTGRRPCNPVTAIPGERTPVTEEGPEESGRLGHSSTLLSHME